MSMKCVVVGDSGVGKTCLLFRRKTNSFPHDNVPNVLDNFSVTMMIADWAYNAYLFDTAGGEDYDRLRPLDYPNTDIFLICFSVVSPASFENVREKWFPEVKHFRPDTPFLIVGTKVDLREDPKYSNSPRVSREKGERLARELGAAKYVECSALTEYKLNEVFEEALAASRKPPSSEKRATECVIC